MESTVALLYQIGLMVLILLVGILCNKKGIISEQGNKDLSNLLLLVVNPLLVFLSYQQEYSPEKVIGLLWTMLFTAAAMGLMIFLSSFLVRKKDNPYYRVERFCAAYPNCGFIGIPIINGVFGQEGVFYLTGVMTVFNLFMWTHGVLLMKGQAEETVDWKELCKSMVNPVIIAAIVGFVCYVLQLSVPVFLVDGFEYLANMNTGLAMLIAGMTLAQTNLRQVLKKRSIYWVAFLKLMLYPVIILLLLRFLPFNPMILLTVVVALGCPTAAGAAAFALRYDRDPVYTSEIFSVCTILAAITLPLLLLLNTGLETWFHLVP